MLVLSIIKWLCNCVFDYLVFGIWVYFSLYISIGVGNLLRRWLKPKEETKCLT